MIPVATLQLDPVDGATDTGSDDGKDAKLFTDTKDRIFNVAISTSPSNEHPKESIIGTGVSGTVYWDQLKSGDRDHLEDAHWMAT